MRTPYAGEEHHGGQAEPDSVRVGPAARFTTAGFPDPGGAIDVVLSYVIGMSTTEAAWLTTVARSGQTEAEFIDRLMPPARQAAAGYDYLNKASAAAPAMPDPAAERD